MTIDLPTITDGEDKTSPLVNCIRNNYRHMRKWAKRTGTDCFRIYDRELHHYPLAIDFYAGRYCIHYFSRSRDEQEAPEVLIQEINHALSTLFGAQPDVIYWRTRKKSKETRQYEKMNTKSKEFFIAQEYGVKFWVNLVNYLDTGLFLDHRETRQQVAATTKGKRVLNLFAYTCAFSVQAATAGATFTKSIDMSNTYTAWGQENFLLNGLSLDKNVIVRADCLKFLDGELRSGTRYDCVVIDPPTISRSKKMTQLFDIHVDYIYLIESALKLLLPGGVVFFSTNSRKFVFDESLFPDCSIVDITSKTLPQDFHDKKIHRCWKITIA